MFRLTLLIASGLLLSACENRDRLSDAEASAAAAQPTNDLIVPESGGDLSIAAPTGPGELVYRALGTEPGWALTVRREAMLFQGNYGQLRIVEATPPNFRPAAGNVRSGRLTITIGPGPCSDGMSDHLWRDTVTVAVTGGQVARGCGGGMIAVTDPNAIEGPRYRVTAVNGAAIRQAEGWWLTFSGGQVSGQFGCDSFGGGYRRNGDHLSLVGNLSQNVTACPATEAWDKAGRRVLGSNPRIEQVEGMVRLVSEAGTIELAAPPKETPAA